MKAGAVEFLTKPFRDQDLLDAIKVALERSRSRNESEKAVSELRAKFESLSPREKEGYGAGNWRSPQQANRCRARSERGYRKGPSWQRNAENGS
jgi:DNA-binding response OmpR family regulator